MPHVTLLYPFHPRAAFDDAAKRMRDLRVPPFPVTLATFRAFPGAVWLDPEPREPWIRLQAALHERFPDCDDVRRHPDGYRAHLTVATRPAPGLERELQSGWKPLSFELRSIALIAREEGRPFEVIASVPLG